MNKKIAIIISAVVIVLASGGFLIFKSKSKSLTKQLNAVKEDMSSYYLEGNMKMLDGEDLKEFLVKVSFTSTDENEYFKVALYDKTLNQDQVIIKNNDGVFVITPTLNRAFQFKSDWPYNSPKPYIYQSLLDAFDGEYEKEKSSDGYLITSDVIYTSNPNITKQEIKFDKDLNPVYVNVLSADDVELVQLDITSFEMNASIDLNEFDIQSYISNQETPDAENNEEATNETASIDDLPLYPIEVMGSVLVSEDELSIDGTINHVLQFDGAKSFTIIESTLSKSEEFSIEVMSGEMIDLISGVAVYGDNELQVVSSGVVCQIYSNELELAEMISVLNSMQNAVMK